MNATDFLKKKGLVKEPCKEFIISGDFGEVVLNDLMEEFKRGEQAPFNNVATQEIRVNKHYPEESGHSFGEIEEEARRIIREFRKAGSRADYESELISAAQSALFFCDEIIKENKEYRSVVNGRRYDYWRLVREKIQDWIFYDVLKNACV
jgi:hypothetical protein